MAKQKLIACPLLTVLYLTSIVFVCSAAEIKIPVRDFARHEKFSSIKISPDGKHLAVNFLTEDGRTHLGILEIQESSLKARANIKVGSLRNVEEFYWVTNKRLIYTISEKRGSLDPPGLTGEIFATNVDGTQHRIIFGYRARDGAAASRLRKRESTYGGHEIIDILKDDPKNVLITVYPWTVKGQYWVTDTDRKPELSTLNVINGKVKIIATLPTFLSSAIVDNGGDLRFANTSEDFVSSKIYKYNGRRQGWSDFNNPNITTDWDPWYFEKNNQWLYLVKQSNTNAEVLQRLNTASGEVNTLFESGESEITGTIEDVTSKEIIAVRTEVGSPEWTYLNREHRLSALHRGLLKAFPEHDVSISSQARDGSKLILQVYSPRNAGDFYLYDTKTKNARYLLSRRNWLPINQLAYTKPISFIANDGLIINGYLTLPNNREGNQKVPLVVYPHGGPHGPRDFWGYNSDVQFLAHNGYGVLQVNFRGSGGYGEQFERAGHGEWGGKMQDDISDATRWAIAEGITDKNSICIYGASYGGYAALMGVATTNLYQCAVGYVGVYDLEMMRKEGDTKDMEQGLKFLDIVIGTDSAQLRQRSPVHLAENIKVPVFLIHGRKDERVPIEHAEALKLKLNEYNKSYEWYVEDREYHGFFIVDNRVKLYKKLLAFLDKNIGNKFGR